jgi:hypothetical protein
MIRICRHGLQDKISERWRCWLACINELPETAMLQGNASLKWRRAMIARDGWTSLWIRLYKWQSGPPSTPLILGYTSVSQLLAGDALITYHYNFHARFHSKLIPTQESVTWVQKTNIKTALSCGTFLPALTTNHLIRQRKSWNIWLA